MPDSVKAVRPDPRFFLDAAPVSIKDVTELVAGALARPGAKPSASISHVAPSHAACRGAVIFASDKRAVEAAAGTPALVLTTDALVDKAAEAWPEAAILTVSAPKAAFAAVAARLHQSRLEDPRESEPASPSASVSPRAQIDPTAVIMADAQIAANVQIGPFAMIGPGVTIGAGTRIGAHASVSHAIVGENCAISAGVRVGEAGFGYVPGPTGAVPLPQLGRVIIGDAVDIGANSTVDRGALEDTVIGNGTKIDNLCQIAHNCRLGQHVLIASQTGVSGSCVIGDGVMIGGQVGMADHLTIGDGAVITAKSGLMRDIPPGEKWGGIPAKPAREWLKEIAIVAKLAKKGTT